MAYEGEVVKLQDGRWARFQRLSVTDPAGNSSALLVAVELEARYQQMLDAAQGGLRQQEPAPVRMSLTADESGNYALQMSAQ